MAKIEKNEGQLAVILIRGRIGVPTTVKQTLDQLGLTQKHACAVVPASLKGVLISIKDYTTYGTVSPEVVAKITAKSKDKKRIRCSLPPPRGGFERKGTKLPYTRGGALGDRGADMDKLVLRMM